MGCKSAEADLQLSELSDGNERFTYHFSDVPRWGQTF